MNAPACKALPNGDIVLCRPVEPAVRLQLERITAQTAENVYHLSKERILTACEDGVAIEHLRDFLLAQIDHDLPDTVRVLFQEIEDYLHKFSLDSTGYLIHCTDPWLITLVANEPTLKNRCRVVGDHHLYL